MSSTCDFRQISKTCVRYSLALTNLSLSDKSHRDNRGKTRKNRQKHTNRSKKQRLHRLSICDWCVFVIPALVLVFQIRHGLRASLFLICLDSPSIHARLKLKLSKGWSRPKKHLLTFVVRQSYPSFHSKRVPFVTCWTVILPKFSVSSHFNCKDGCISVDLRFVWPLYWSTCKKLHHQEIKLRLCSRKLGIRGVCFIDINDENSLSPWFSDLSGLFRDRHCLCSGYVDS